MVLMYQGDLGRNLICEKVVVSDASGGQWRIMWENYHGWGWSLVSDCCRGIALSGACSKCGRIFTHDGFKLPLLDDPHKTAWSHYYLYVLRDQCPDNLVAYYELRNYSTYDALIQGSLVTSFLYSVSLTMAESIEEKYGINPLSVVFTP